MVGAALRLHRVICRSSLRRGAYRASLSAWLGRRAVTMTRLETDRVRASDDA
jgi:hypothetical protein